MDSTNIQDHYEVLQLSPNADSDTIERVYRMLAKRYHPDNRESGNVERFTQLREAYAVLSDPEKRAEYDVHYEEIRGRLWQIFDQAKASNSFDDDKKVFEGVMSLLYVSRRRDVDHAGIGTMEIERMLGCPEEHLDFHLWYLRKKGWIERLDNGKIALTVEGVDEVISGDLLLKRDRLLTGDVERDRRDDFNGDRVSGDGGEEAAEPDQIEGGNKLDGQESD